MTLQREEPSTLKIGSWNIRGLPQIGTLLHMLHYFKKEYVDIVLLQETHTPSHATPSLTVQFLAALGWQIHHSGHTNSSAGVAILMRIDLLQKPLFKLCGSNTYRDSALPGRLLSIWFIWNRRSYILYNVYCPCSSQYAILESYIFNVVLQSSFDSLPT